MEYLVSSSEVAKVDPAQPEPMMIISVREGRLVPSTEDICSSREFVICMFLSELWYKRLVGVQKARPNDVTSCRQYRDIHRSPLIGS